MRSCKRTLILMFAVCSLLIIVISGCETLKLSKPIQEYEKMLMGRLDANYVGTDNCLSACHYHDDLRKDFEASTMGVQMSSTSHMPLVNCESCHGPGSLAVEGITPDKVASDMEEGRQTSCNFETFINIKNLPSQAKSLICLKCHTENATFNLHNWNAGEHAIADVSCSDCHQLHAGPALITEAEELNGLCFSCHQREKAEFALPSRHPVLENKIFCWDCHEHHGTLNEGMLKEDTVKETCTACHGEKEGPFVFEHADLDEDCTTCHSSHGSINNNLLTVSEPFLCLQCHGGHQPGTLEEKGAYYTRCSDCHSQIHGTDLPSSGGTGMFIN